MVCRIVIVAAWSVAGVALTVALIGGGFVLAGTTLTEPAAPIRVSVATLIPRPSASRGGDADTPSPGRASAPPTGGFQPTGASPPPSGADDALTGSGGDGGAGEREVAADD